VTRTSLDEIHRRVGLPKGVRPLVGKQAGGRSANLRNNPMHCKLNVARRLPLALTMAGGSDTNHVETLFSWSSENRLKKMAGRSMVAPYGQCACPARMIGPRVASEVFYDR
jgi:hypothetical protein